MKKKIMMILSLILITNLFITLVGCTSIQEENNKVNVYNLDIDLKTSERLAKSVMTSNLKENGFYLTYDKEVDFDDNSVFYDGSYYRYLIEDKEIALESALLVNKETGVVTVCYPDDTYKQVRDDDTFELDDSIWQGNYWKELSEEEVEGNCYSILSVSELDNNLYISLDAYFGHGGLKLKMNCKLSDSKIANYKDEYKEIEFILTDENTIECNVLQGDNDIVEALQGVFN